MVSLSNFRSTFAVVVAACVPVVALAYVSGKENAGPTDARETAASGGWMDPSTFSDPSAWAVQLDPQEHGGLLLLAMNAAGIPSDMFSLDATTVYIDANQPTYSGFTPVAPAPFSSAATLAGSNVSGVGANSANAAITRQYAPVSLAGLGDHSFALWDWVEGNEKCPDAVQDGTAVAADTVFCHALKGHLGATNSSHFLPQADSMYQWYHAMALARAQQCGTLKASFANAGVSLQQALPDYVNAFLRECTREALAIEAIGQHFLQDAWAIGHQWHRWGAPDLGQFPISVATSAGLNIATDRLMVARLVALASGMIHGAETVSRGISGSVNSPPHGANILKGDRMSGGGQFVQSPSGAVTTGKGDYFGTSVVTNAAQFTPFLNCMIQGLRDVYEATQGTTSSAPPITDLSRGGPCFGQRATNLSMLQGSGLDVSFLNNSTPIGVIPSIELLSALDMGTIPFNIVVGWTAPAGSVLPIQWPVAPIATALGPEWVRELVELNALLAVNAEGLLGGDPNGTNAATFTQGSITGVFNLAGFKMLGVPPNDIYDTANHSQPTPYLDPKFPTGSVKSWPTSTAGVERNDIHAREIARFFNRAHLADWCDDPETKVAVLVTAVSNASTATRATACHMCVEFAGRHITLTSGGPSACMAANSSDGDLNDVSQDPALASLTPQAALQLAAQKKCGCAPAVTIFAASGDSFHGNLTPLVTETIASIDSRVAVNKGGAIAFSAFDTDGTSAGAVVTAPHNSSPITFIGTSSRNFGGASLNDATPTAQAAFRERVSGAPPIFLVRRWNSDLTPQTDIAVSGAGLINDGFASASFFQDINDAGVVVFPALDPNSINQLLLVGNGTKNPLGRHNLQTLGTFADTPNILLRPQIASTNQVVYRDAIGSIVVAQATPSSPGSVPVTVQVAPTSQFSNLTDRPGISADGSWVAFGGTLTGLNPGLFVTRATPGGLTPFTGAKGLLFTGSGGDPSNANAMFNSFGVRPSGGVGQARFGIAVLGSSITIVFVASRSYLDPNTHAVTKTVYGVYRLTATAAGAGDATVYQNIHVNPIVEVGDVLSDVQAGTNVNRTVADFDLWDPLSKDGLYAGFWVQFSETGPSGAIQAVVRAQF